MDAERPIIRHRSFWEDGRHDDEMAQLHAQNLTDREIAVKMGFAPATIAIKRVAKGLVSNLPRKPYSPPESGERPRARTKQNPGWDFSRDNLDLPKDI